MISSCLHRCVVGVALACALALGACAGPAEQPVPTDAGVRERAQEPSRLFGSGHANPFTLDVSSAPLHPRSAAMRDHLRAQIRQSRDVAVLNTSHYNSTLWIADAQTPRVVIGFDNCQDKPDTPPGLYDGPAYFQNVPMPAQAQPADGRDGALTVWSPATDQLWEFWVANRRSDGSWTACWGGRIDGLSGSAARFSNPFGASASGLATVATMISVQEARDLRIEHAMSLGLTAVAAPDRVYWPANRSDGTDTSADALPMGARLRLDPAVDVAELGLPPLGAEIARAAQRYGFIVTETSGAVAIGAESGKAEQARTGVDPWPAILAGVPDYAQLEGFPWDRVEVLEPNYGAPQSESPG